MTNQTASQKIGAYAASVQAESVSPRIVHQVARAFADTFAVALAGREEPPSQIARDYALACGSGPATLWATGERVRAEDAALVNAVTAHILDYDDVSEPLHSHPSAVMLPALVALGEVEGATGAQVAAAYMVGFEVAMKLGNPIMPAHTVRGWHSTSTIGTIGAAVACAHLLGLTAEQVAATVGVAVSQTGGVRRSFGTMCKSLQAGNAAAAAVRSARLAAGGFTSAPDILEGRQGYVHLFGQNEDLGPSLGSLGQEPCELLATGLAVKKYPACWGVHRAADGLLDLMAERPIPVSQVERVRVSVEPHCLTGLIYRRPTRSLEGKFSMEYSMAAALLDGGLFLRNFTDEAVQRAEAQALLRRVEAVEEDHDPTPRRALVEVFLRSGERRAIQVTELRGSGSRPLPDAELVIKLQDCLESVGSRIDAQGLLATLLDWSDRPIRSVLECTRSSR